MLPLYHATGVLVLPKSQKSSHVFPTPKGEKERGAANPPRHALSLPLLPPSAASLSRAMWLLRALRKAAKVIDIGKLLSYDAL